MPPSGYSPVQSDHLSRFLEDCAAALLREAAEKRLSPSQALDAELTNIAHHLQSSTVSEAQAGVLTLTRAFYERVREVAPADVAAFETAKRHALRALSDEILAIKVVEIA